MDRVIVYKSWQRSQRIKDDLERLHELMLRAGLDLEAEDVLQARILVEEASSRIDLIRRAATRVAGTSK